MLEPITLHGIVRSYYNLFNDAYIHAFAYVVILDILTGILKGFKQKKLNSTINLWGLIKHTFVICFIVTVYPFLLYVDFKGVAYILVFFFIVSYAISILENFDVLGIPFPRGLRTRLEKIKKELDNKEG